MNIVQYRAGLYTSRSFRNLRGRRSRCRGGPLMQVRGSATKGPPELFLVDPQPLFLLSLQDPFVLLSVAWNPSAPFPAQAERHSIPQHREPFLSDYCWLQFAFPPSKYRELRLRITRKPAGRRRNRRREA